MLIEWRLRMIRHREQKKLDEKNLALYKSMTSYIANSDLNGREKEEVLQQIMDMLLQAQVENKSVDLFIGNDYEVFCDNIIKEYTNDKSRAYKVLSYIQKYLIWLVLIGLNMVIVGGIINKSGFYITMEQFMFANYFALFVVPLSRKARQINAYTPLAQRFYINRDESIISLVLVGFLMVVFKFVVGRLFGKDVFYLKLGLLESVPYIGIILLIAAAIEVYRRVYDRR